MHEPKLHGPYEFRTIALISHGSKVMLKILQARLQQYMNHELLEAQAGFRKGRGTRNQIAYICWIIEKAREFQKNISLFNLLAGGNHRALIDAGGLVGSPCIPRDSQESSPTPQFKRINSSVLK